MAWEIAKFGTAGTAAVLAPAGELVGELLVAVLAEALVVVVQRAHLLAAPLVVVGVELAAVRGAVAAARDLPDDVFLAVNVSAIQLRNRSFVEELERLMRQDDRTARGLELEITESVIVEDIKHNVASLTTIRDMGIRISIDDFGTGFSSLSYLSILPIDTLKIDRSFVMGLDASAKGTALVAAIIGLAHALDLNVVAEGVETEPQRQILADLHCNEMQGFLFSAAVPGDLFFERFLAKA